MKLSARRSRVKHAKSSGLFVLLIVITIFLIGILFLVWNLFFRTKYWDGENKLNLVVRGSEDNITIISFDPKSEEINKIVIPGTTEVDVSRGLGNFRIKNVWQLGIDEKLNGQLLAETVTKNFSIPTYAWADSGALGYTGGLLKTVNAVFSRDKTNLSFSDKIHLGIFSLSIKNNNVSQIDLTKIGFLRKAKLKDGDDGYIILNEVPQELVLALSSQSLANSNLKIQVNNQSGDQSIEESIGKIFDVIGTKVASFNRDGESDKDCEVKGASKELVQETSRVFECNISSKKSDFDVELTVGTKFASRF